MKNDNDNDNEIPPKSESVNITKNNENDLEDPSLEYEAYNLCRKAEQTLSPSCCLVSLFSSSQEVKNIEAYTLYKQAGIKYKTCHKYKEASDCFEKCADLQIKTKEDPLEAYQESYHCLELNENNDEENKRQIIFDKLMLYLQSKGDFYESAKLCEKVASEHIEKQKFNTAIEFYEKSAEFYKMDGKHNSKKNEVLVKLAELMCLHEHKDASTKAGGIFDQVGREYLKNNLTKYAAKDEFTKAVLCLILYSGEEEGEMYLNKYKEIDPTFEGSDGFRLCEQVIKGAKEKEIKELQNEINSKYREYIKLDDFSGQLIIKIMEKIKNNGREKINDDDDDLNVEDFDPK